MRRGRWMSEVPLEPITLPRPLFCSLTHRHCIRPFIRFFFALIFLFSTFLLSISFHGRHWELEGMATITEIPRAGGNKTLMNITIFFEVYFIRNVSYACALIKNRSQDEYTRFCMIVA